MRLTARPEANSSNTRNTTASPRLVDFPPAGGRVVAIAVEASRALRDLPAPGPLFLAPHGALGDLLALDLCDERTRREDEPTDRRVLEPLGNELELCARLRVERRAVSFLGVSGDAGGTTAFMVHPAPIGSDAVIESSMEQGDQRQIVGGIVLAVPKDLWLICQRIPDGSKATL